MHFYLPRRHRRSLFLPPGLVALAGLLWLETSLMNTHSDQLKVQSVIQLTVPALNPTLQEAEDVSVWPLNLSLDKLNKFRPWHDVYFRGNHEHDLLEQKIATRAVDEILEDYGHRGGVRIRFAQNANYEQFVFALDLMEREGIPNYWLDMRRNSTTFYGFANGYNSRPTTLRHNGDTAFFNNGVWQHGHFSGCFFISDATPDLPPDLWNLIWLQSDQPKWQISVWLLAAIVTLSFWRMARTWRRPNYSA